jgi:acyl carrier protein
MHLRQFSAHSCCIAGTLLTLLRNAHRGRSMEHVLTTADRVRTLLQQEPGFRGGPDLRDDTPLIETGALDSFGMIGLVIAIEEEFGIKVRPEEATKIQFRTISSIAAYIEVKLHGHHRR